MAPSLTTISMMDLRSHPEVIVDRVFYRNECVVIERAGEPCAVLVPVREYEQMQRHKQEAKERFFTTVDTIRQRLATQDPQAVEEAFAEALQAAGQP